LTFIEEYYNEIQSGRIVAGKKIRKQYEKLVHDIHNPYSTQQLQPDGNYKTITYVFDEDKASLPIEFIETFCKQSKAPYCGQPLKLMLWQKALIQSIYGFVDAETGLRRYKEVLVEVARKNGKSTLLSGLAAFHLICEQGAQIVTAANSKSQASIIFEEAKNMLMQSPALSTRAKKRKYDLFIPSTFSTMQPLASDSSNLDGLNADLVLLDEIHEFTNTKLYDIVKQSQGTKLEPLLIMITTNGFVRDSFFDSKLEYANKVLNGLIEDCTHISFLYELDEEGKKGIEEVKDFKNWIKANPALGQYRSFAELTELCKKAENDTSFRPTLFAKYFNLPQTASENWLSFDELNNTETFDLEEFRGCYCMAGFDLSEVGDLTCGTILFMRPGNDKKYVHQMYFIPAGLLEQKERDDKVPYSKWIEKGWLMPSGTSKIDTDDVINWFVNTVQKYDLYVQKVGYDRWGAAYFKKRLSVDYGVEMIDVIQGAKTFSQPMKALKADLIDKNIVYQNNPVLKWCFANTRVVTDTNGNVRPDKGRNGKRRIDGTVSLLDAFVVLLDNYAEFTNLL